MRHAWLLSLMLTPLLAPAIARAQRLETFFPEGVPGYGTEPGVTVMSRKRPAFDPLGIRIGNAILSPSLSMSFGYDDNAFGAPNAIGSWRTALQPALLVAGERSDTSFGAYVSADDERYLNQPSQNHTGGAAFAGGGYAPGRDRLTFAAGWLRGFEGRTELDAQRSDKPIGFQVANARASYAVTLARGSVTPTVEVSTWRYDNTTTDGAPVSEAARDRTSARASVDAAYTIGTGRTVHVVVRALDTIYAHPTPGAPSNDSITYQVLAGLDYDDNTVWRYRLLAGVEVRQPASAAYAVQTKGMGEAELVWQPSGLTTITALLVRGLEDAAQTGLSNYTYTTVSARIDHELYRNLLLTATARFATAHYNQTGGDQFGPGATLGMTWLVNRTARVSLTYDVASVRDRNMPTGTVAGSFTRDLLLLTLRLGL